jgi:MoaA/NifB/PqqE/SkfB family radical SAM enzyme
MEENFLHVELTSRCTLACPACPRTEWHNLLKRPAIKNDLDIDVFEKFLDCDEGQKIQGFKLCGDYGDCIYYPELFEFIKRFRSTKKFAISTNGSFQTEQFWNTLAGLLTDQDTIIFGIDGLEDTNHLYRKNSNWSSIMLAVDIMAKSSVKVKWQTIVFSFNHDQLDTIKSFAESKGAEFFSLRTHRYGDASLIPPNEHVELHYLFKEDYNNNHNIPINPGCKNEKVITSDGYLLPCDWIRNPGTFYKSQLWKQKSRWVDQLNIKNTTYDQALLVVDDWANYVRQSSLNNLPTVDVLCKMKCREECKKT